MSFPRLWVFSLKALWAGCFYLPLQGMPWELVPTYKMNFNLKLSSLQLQTTLNAIYPPCVEPEARNSAVGWH